MKRTRISKILTVLFAVVLCSGPVGLAEQVGTAFTYQGRLIDNNQPADGLYDLQFKLFDSEEDKSVSSSVTTNSAAAGGYLNVFQYFWTEQPISTDCNYVTLWVSGDGYSTSARYAWHIAIVFSDGVNTATDTIRCDCWGYNEGCNPDHYDYYSGTATGADGRTWKRYTRAIPSQITKNNLTIKIEHEQAAWDGSAAGSWYRLDSVYLSGANGQLIQPITNGVFAADATGTTFSDITGWDYSITSTNGVAQDLSIVDDYYFTAPTQIGQAVIRNDVDVLDGYFTVRLDSNDTNAFNGDTRWLEIGVRAGDLNDPNAYTALAPKQNITATPYALYAKTAGSGGSADSDWIISGSNVYSGVSGNVGIGTTTPGAKLEVAGQVKITGGSPAAGKVLTSDAAGLAIWQTPASTGDNLGNHTATQNIRLNGNWLSYGAGSQGVFVASDGKVGIWTNAPTGILHAAGGTAYSGQDGLGITLKAEDGYSAGGPTGDGTDGGNITLQPGAGGNGGWFSGADGLPGRLIVNGAEIAVSNDDKGVSFYGGARIYKKSGSGLKIVAHDDTAGVEFLRADGATRNMIIKAGAVGIGTTDPGAYALYVSGTAYSTGGWQSSDLRFKKDIGAIDSPIDKIRGIRGVAFEWKTSEYEEKGFPEGRHYGVIAQEVEKVLPEIVREGPAGEKAVSYTELVPILTEAIKEQQKQIEFLRSEVEALKEAMRQNQFTNAKELQQ